MTPTTQVVDKRDQDLNSGPAISWTNNVRQVSRLGFSFIIKMA